LNSSKHQILTLETVFQYHPKEAFNFKFYYNQFGLIYNASQIKSLVNPLLVDVSHIFICKNVSNLNINPELDHAMIICQTDPSLSLPTLFFSNLLKLEIINFVLDVNCLPVGCFDGCKSLTSIIFHGAVESFGRESFSGCSSLTTFEVPETVHNVPDGFSLDVIYLHALFFVVLLNLLEVDVLVVVNL
jgi:hypothetical protein